MLLVMASFDQSSWSVQLPKESQNEIDLSSPMHRMTGIYAVMQSEKGLSTGGFCKVTFRFAR